MKTLSNIIKNDSNALECILIDGASLVSGTIIKGQQTLFKRPCPASEVSCSACGCEIGIKITDAIAKRYLWGCSNPECFNPKVKPRLKQEPVEIPGILYPKSCWADCHQTVENIEKARNFTGNMALLHGDNGTGKTYMACCMLQDLARRKNIDIIRFWDVGEIYDRWRSSMGNDRGLLDSLTDNVGIILDDMGIVTPTDGFLDFLFLVINRRHMKYPTIITTNLTGIDCVNRLGSAITSRISSGLILKIEGEDRRMSF